jgi:hypothetical protein
MYLSLAGSPAGIQQKTEFREEGRAAFGRCLLVSILHSAKFHWRFTAGFQQDFIGLPLRVYRAQYYFHRPSSFAACFQQKTEFREEGHFQLLLYILHSAKFHSRFTP